MHRLRIAVLLILIVLGVAADPARIMKAIKVFVTGALGFGTVSLLPALISGWVIWDTARSKSPSVDFGAQGGSG
jgi:hypothetical protein